LGGEVIRINEAKIALKDKQIIKQINGKFNDIGSADEEGCAVEQAVRRWLPTAAARVRVLAACGVCGGQRGIGAGFLRVLRFPLPIIPPISPSSQSPGAGTIGLLVATVPGGPNWTPLPHYTNLKKLLVLMKLNIKSL
jgi:hypothetical protein